MFLAAAMSASLLGCSDKNEGLRPELDVDLEDLFNPTTEDIKLDVENETTGYPVVSLLFSLVGFNKSSKLLSVPAGVLLFLLPQPTSNIDIAVAINILIKHFFLIILKFLSIF